MADAEEWQGVNQLRGVATDWSERGDGSCQRSGGAADDRGCAYSTLRKTICALENDGTGKPVRKCETIEQRLRKCTGRPQEVVDSKVEVTEEPEPTSLGAIFLSEEGNEGSNVAFPRHWHDERSGHDEAMASGMQPFGGIFRRRSPASLEDVFKDVLRAPFDLSAEEETFRATPGAPNDGDHIFSWFSGIPFGGRRPRAPPDRSGRQTAEDYYEALARGIQEV